MSFFGLGRYGVLDYLKFVKNSEYVEPEKYLDLQELIKKEGRRKSMHDLIHQVMHNIDFESGQADGYSYKSRKRIDTQRAAGCFKLDGPCEMYRVPATESMVVGWFLCDPELKEGRNWWLPSYRSTVVKSDNTRCVEESLKK